MIFKRNQFQIVKFVNHKNSLTIKHENFINRTHFD
jgi:hypothetical protein